MAMCASEEQPENQKLSKKQKQRRRQRNSKARAQEPSVVEGADGEMPSANAMLQQNDELEAPKPGVEGADGQLASANTTTQQNAISDASRRVQQAEAELLEVYAISEDQGPEDSEGTDAEMSKKNAISEAQEPGVAEGADGESPCEDEISQLKQTLTQQEATAALLATENGDLEDLTAALECWGDTADSEVVSNMRAKRRVLKEKQRKHKRKAGKVDNARKSLEGAMQAGTDVKALETAIANARQYGTLNSLIDKVEGQLDVAKCEQRAMQKEAALEQLEKEFVALAMNPSDSKSNKQREKDTDEKLCIVCEDLAREVCLACVLMLF